MTQETIDAATFKALQEAAGADFVTELVATFLDDEAPAMMAEIESALAAGDAERFRRMAHSLKSNSNTFGAVALGLAARDLELSGLAAVSTRPQPLATLAAEYERAAARLREMARG
jgi:HPt (histidine-containing phosphotransfer) domain-containing protein